ncbi:MAG: hypothetical protein Q8P95_00905 [bacterium]|nr:hypothetical protein [bacterium]
MFIKPPDDPASDDLSISRGRSTPDPVIAQPGLPCIPAATTAVRRNVAIVIGGSLAGLFSAELLSDHYDEVLVFEKDQNLPASLGEERNMSPAPQAHMPHFLAPGGMDLAEARFPGLYQELLEQGAVETHWGGPNNNTYWSPSFGRNEETLDMTLVPGGLRMITCTRVLLESVIRRRIQSNRKVRLHPGTKIVDLIVDDERNRITGVKFDCSGEAGEVSEECSNLNVQLLVDASGSNSKTFNMLANRGYPEPEEERVDPKLVYVRQEVRFSSGLEAQIKETWLRLFPERSTATISEIETTFRRLLLNDEISGAEVPALILEHTRLQELEEPADKLIFIMKRSQEGNHRAAYLVKHEMGGWVLLMGGSGDTPPPQKSGDEEGIRSYLQNLGDDVLFRVLKDADMVGSPNTWAATANVRRRVEEMKKRVENMVWVGDAHKKRNPIYGQGITEALREALLLDHIIQEQGSGSKRIAEVFLQADANMMLEGGLLAEDGDCKVEGVRIHNPRWWHPYRKEILGDLVDVLFKKSGEDAEMMKLMLEIFMQKKHIHWLFHPRFLRKYWPELREILARHRQLIVGETKSPISDFVRILGRMGWNVLKGKKHFAKFWQQHTDEIRTQQEADGEKTLSQDLQLYGPNAALRFLFPFVWRELKQWMFPKKASKAEPTCHPASSLL